MAKKEVKEAVKKVVEEVKAEEIPVEVVAEEKPKAPFRRLVAAGGQEWYVDENDKKIED